MKLSLAIIFLIATGQISYGQETNYTFKDVQGVLNARCVLCHNNQLALGRLQGGLNLANYKDVMRGVIPGHPIKSAVYTFANTGYMPHGDRPRLSEAEKDVLYFWIYNGASNASQNQGDWQWINQNIIVNQCTYCHTEGKATPALDFDSNRNYQALRPLFTENFVEAILNQPNHSALNLSDQNESIIKQWINAGALNTLEPKANWTWINEFIIQKQCRVCHNDQLVELSTYDDVIKLVIPGNPTDSPLFGAVESGFMPQDIPLYQNEIDAIYEWIVLGAEEN